MLPLLPFIAGVATGAFAVNALRRRDVSGDLQRIRRYSAQWRELWRQAGEAAAAAPDANDLEMIDATENTKGAAPTAGDADESSGA